MLHIAIGLAFQLHSLVGTWTASTPKSPSIPSSALTPAWSTTFVFSKSGDYTAHAIRKDHGKTIGEAKYAGKYVLYKDILTITFTSGWSTPTPWQAPRKSSRKITWKSNDKFMLENLNGLDQVVVRVSPAPSKPGRKSKMP